jgi:AcrR family transcriptional regulator
MPRKPGDRNRDYEERRQAILERLHRHVTPPPETPPSLRDLAQAAKVSLPTLKHYFGGRAAVIAAVMAHQGKLAQPYIAHLATTDLPFEASIAEVVRFLANGLFEARVSDIHAFGLAEGALMPALGRAYLEALLEPTLQALEARLAYHIRQGDMKPATVRHAALMLAAPLILGALHQVNLGGEALRPLNAQDFCSTVIDTFVRTYQTEKARPAP